jgi:hypothetical protein
MNVRGITFDPPTRSDQKGQNKDQNQQRAEVKSWRRIKAHHLKTTILTSTFGGIHEALFARAAFFNAAHLFRVAAPIRARPSLRMRYFRRRLPFSF